MSIHLPRPRRRRRRRRLHLGPRCRRGLVVAAGCVLAATPAVPGTGGGTATTPAAPAPLTAAAAVTLTEDASLKLVQTAHDETTGDFRNFGYEQRALVENGHLHVYLPAERGGNIVRSTPTDLQPAAPSGNDGHGNHLPVWAGAGGVANDNRLAAVYLDWTPDALYMAGMFNAGSSTNPGDPSGTGYQSMLYKLPPDGTCAMKSCAIWTQVLPSYVAGRSPFYERAVGPTSLAAGTVGGESFVAVGMSEAEDQSGADEGVWVFRDNDQYCPGARPEVCRLWHHFGDYQDPGWNQTVTSALAWDPGGSGRLAIGVTSPAKVLHSVVQVGEAFWYWAWWDQDSGGDYSPSALSTAVGKRADGSLILAFGMSDGTVKLWDPGATTSSLLAGATGTDPVDALTFVDRIDGTSGAQDIVAVSSKGNSAHVWRYDLSSTLKALPLGPNNDVTSDVGGIHEWYPGYRTGSMKFTNNTSDTIRLDFASRPNASYGCWFAPAIGNRAAFPTSSVTIAPNATAGPYTIGGLTAGVDGGCAAQDSTGERAAYVVMTPVARPADRTVAKFKMMGTGQLFEMETAGGSFNFVGNHLQGPFAYGSWDMSITGPPPADAPAGIKLIGSRLDQGETDQPVYRFDVPAVTWGLPFSSPLRVQAVVPPLRVHGTTANGDTVDLGLLVPQGPPARDTSGSVTLAPVSFYWQNGPSSPQITAINVTATSDHSGATTTSNTVTLADLPTPTPGSTTPTQLDVCPALGSAACDATASPANTGLDQAPLRIQIFGDSSTLALPVSNPLYGRIYYTDENGELLTGLVPSDGSPYLRVSPYAGAYPNDGSSPIGRTPIKAPVGGRYGYVTTTSTTEQQITAHLGGSQLYSQSSVRATRFAPTLLSGSQGTGFQVGSCSDYSTTAACQLAVPDKQDPALFLTTDPTSGELRIGLQFQTVAVSALTSLPLQQLAGQPEHRPATSLVDVNNGVASLSNTSVFQPADTIDTWVVTHGVQVPVTGLRVGGGN